MKKLPGRKIDVFEARGRETGPVTEIDIRMDRDAESDPFLAEYCGQIYRAPTQKALEDKITEAVRARESIAFQRFLEVEVDRPDTRIAAYNGYQIGSAGKIMLSWRIVDISDEVDGPRGDKVRLGRYVHVMRDGTIDETYGTREPSVYREPLAAKLVPFTDERFEAIKRIEAQIAALREKLLEVLHGEQAADFLQSAGASALRLLEDAAGKENG